MTKTEIKHKAQAMIMHAIAVKRGYWQEYELDMSEADKIALSEELHKQAQRVAKIMGYASSWIA